MIEAIAILAIGAAILLYAECQSNKKTIEEQSYKIRHLTGNLNEDDKRENQQLLDDYHFDKIVRELKSADEYAQFEPDDVIEERLKLLQCFDVKVESFGGKKKDIDYNKFYNKAYKNINDICNDKTNI